MKKFFYSLMFGAAILAAAACTRTDDPGYRTYDVKIQLVYPSESEFSAVEGVTVSVRSTVNEATYSGTTDAEGITVIGLPAGVYEVSASDRRAAAGTSYILSGVASNVTVTEDWSSEDVVRVNMTVLLRRLSYRRGNLQILGKRQVYHSVQQLRNPCTT